MTEYFYFVFLQVRNYLPSISAAVGSDTPEIYIWRICIGLHSFLRFGIAFVYYNFYKDGIVSSLSPSLYAAAVKLNCGLSTLENFSLVLLTDVSSTENYGKTVWVNCPYQSYSVPVADPLKIF